MSRESIYEWIKPEPEPPAKAPLYRSKHSPSSPLTGSTIKVQKKQYSTLGAELKGTVRPESFLRAHEKTGFVDTMSIPKATHTMASTMPPVPRRWERPFHAPASNKDFIAENAFAAMTAAPRFKTKTQTDWLKTDTYGRVPAYLDRVKREIESEREYILSLLDQQAMEAEAESGAQTRELSSDERNELIDALKAKWDVVNAKYQQISHRKISTSNSSMGEIRWKETCEQQMAQLEKDIGRLSHHGPVYVVE